ncbi:MAG: aminoacyl-tRNA hydrolase [Campylobacterales bacterium]
MESQLRAVVGLGNPGERYRFTRHNLGFLVVDYLADRWGVPRVGERFHGELFKKGGWLLFKPLTFMNRSGIAVAQLKSFYNLEDSDIIVIHDDIDLKPGQLRFKRGGSDGGHRGLRSLDLSIGNDYWRVRVGVGRPERKSEVVEFVLGEFPPEEFRKCIKPLFPVIEEAVQQIEKAPARYSRRIC